MSELCAVCEMQQQLPAIHFQVIANN